jgi:hypothetical protein
VGTLSGGQVKPAVSNCPNVADQLPVLFPYEAT